MESSKKSKPNQGQKRGRGAQMGDGRAPKRSRLDIPPMAKRRIPDAWVLAPGKARPAKRAKGGGKGIAPTTIK